MFYELSKSNKPSILQLIAAQVEVVKSLEKNWFTDYVAHLNAKKDEEVEKEEERKSACRASTVSLTGYTGTHTHTHTHVTTSVGHT